MSRAVDLVHFAWTARTVGRRLGVYPDVEGDRTAPASPERWSAVETLPRERLEALQLDRLTHLLRVAQARSEFYQRRWDSAGVDAGSVRSLQDLRRLPVITKHDIVADQLARPPFGTLPTSEPGTQSRFWQTSGTTGTPVAWVESKEDWENGMYLYARSLYAHGVRPGWRAFFGFSYPPFIGFWLAHYAAEMMGCQVVPKGPLPTEVWLRLIQRLAPTSHGLLCATPTFAQRQLEVAQAAGIDTAGLGIDILSLAGEPGACVRSTKRALESQWHARVHDIMGSTETSGPLLFTCAAQAMLPEPSPHVNVDYFVTEVLDPESLEPVGDGRPGVLCVTALSRFGMPAVRFLLNDHVTLTWDPCECGRTLPLARGGVRSRADDVVIVNGVNLYPALVQDVVHDIPELTSEYVLVRGDRSTAVVVEVRDGLEVSESLAARVRQALVHATTLSLDVRVVAAGTLPRGETKSRRVQV